MIKLIQFILIGQTIVFVGNRAEINTRILIIVFSHQDLLMATPHKNEPPLECLLEHLLDSLDTALN